MTACITVSTSAGGRPYDLISVMSFLFRDSRAYVHKRGIGGRGVTRRRDPQDSDRTDLYLHGLLQGGQGLVQVSLSVLSHGFTLQLLCPDLLTVGAHRLNTNTQTQSSMSKAEAPATHLFTDKPLA